MKRRVQAITQRYRRVISMFPASFVTVSRGVPHCEYVVVEKWPTAWSRSFDDHLKLRTLWYQDPVAESAILDMQCQGFVTALRGNGAASTCTSTGAIIDCVIPQRKNSVFGQRLL